MGYRHTIIGFIHVVLIACAGATTAAERALTYLILADTVPPLMITTADDPMAGGVVTDVVQQMFANTDYDIRPLVVPWQRMTEEMLERDDWITYGPRTRCTVERGCARSKDPILQFEHVVVTLADSPLVVRNHENLFGRNLLLVDNFHYPGLDQYLATPVDQAGSGEIRDIRAFTPEGALRMLRHRRGEAYIDWRLRVMYNLSGAGLAPGDVRLTDASNIVPTQGIHLIYSDKLSAELRAFIDERLAEMHLDGTLANIIDRATSPLEASFTK